MNIKALMCCVSTVMIVACGGGGSSTSNEAPAAVVTTTPPPVATFTGMFLDSAVEGLSYSTDSSNGMTNTSGEFSYQANEEITFSIGDIEFAPVAAATVITPLNLFETDDINNLAVVNMLRLLQSLDFDGDASNGVQIAQSAHDAAQGLNVDFSSENFDNQVMELVFNNGGIYQELITAEMAVYHFQQTLTDLNNQGVANCDKTHDMIGYYGYFETLAHGVTGRAEIIDDCTIKVTEFYYDGQGPEVYFYAAIDHQYSGDDAFAISQLLNGQVYENAEFTLRLPDNKTLDDLNSMSIWCVDFDANFGQLGFTP